MTAFRHSGSGAPGNLQPRSRRYLLVPVALLAVGVATQAHAQLLERYFPANVPAYQDWFATLDTSGVGDAYSPLGVRAGSFIIQPSITEGIGYDSNITGTAAAAGSPLLHSNGSVSIDSDWARNSVNAAVTVDDTRYFDDQRQSFTSWTATAGGTIEYADDKIGLGYAHLNTVSLPTDVGTFGLTRPVTGAVDDVRISDTLGPGPLVVVPALDGQIYRFSSSGGESAAAQGLFDRNQLTGSVTAGYEFAGGHNVIVVLNDSSVAYQGSGNGRPADYNDASILAGLEYRQSALFVYRALVGYEERFASGGGRQGGTISAPAAELDLIWSPTKLVSVTGRVVQSLQNEVTAVGQGVTQSNAELILAYALRRNVMLEATAGYGRAGFPDGQGTQSSFTAIAEARWNVNRNLALTLHYDFTSASDSVATGLSFTRNDIILQAKFQL
jgi:hypothetical protein